MKRLAGAVLAGWLVSWATLGSATEVINWERLPLAVSLVVGQERVIFVERNVRIGVPASLAERLRVQSAAGAVYLRASAPFESARVQLQDADTGEQILLDITAKAATQGQPLLEPIKIVTPALKLSTDESSDSPPGSTPAPVVLTRYAAQSLYAPLRTVEALPGVRRVLLHRDLNLGTLLPNLSVSATALAAWRLGDYWVSAVRLRNNSHHWLALDPRELQGHFTTATFQHPSLGPHGRPSDTTVLYLITQGHDLRRSLLPALSPFDAALNLPHPASAAHEQ